jgi:F-type H+-transporting ATPase subunit epsilon
MADTFQLEITTPDRSVLDEQVQEVVLPGVEGYFGVLAGHAPLLAQLAVGEVSYRVGTQRKFLVVSGGYAEVLRDAVHVLARTAERADEIDLDRAVRAKERAEAELKRDLPPDEMRQAEVQLQRALSRISCHQRGA